EDGIRDFHVTGVQTCALPILRPRHRQISDMKAVQQRVDTHTALRRCEALQSEADIVADIEMREERIVLKYEADTAIFRRHGQARSEERRVGKEWRCRG